MTASIRFLMGLFVLVALLSVNSEAQDIPTDVRIESVSYKGSGCPNGSVNWSLATNATAISFLFDNYKVQGNAPTLKSDCQFRFMLKYPRNFRLKVVGVDYRGAAELPAGSVAKFSTNILQQNGRIARTIDDGSQTFAGPYSDQFVVSRATTKGDWIQCNGVAGMNYIFSTQLQVSNPSGQDAYVQVDSSDVDIQGGFSFRLAWERCR